MISLFGLFVSGTSKYPLNITASALLQPNCISQSSMVIKSFVHSIPAGYVEAEYKLPIAYSFVCLLSPYCLKRMSIARIPLHFDGWLGEKIGYSLFDSGASFSCVHRDFLDL